MKQKIILLIVALAIVGILAIMTFREESSENTEPNVPVTNSSTGTTTQRYTRVEVALHNTPGSCWTIVGNKVYDLTAWIDRHPGGPERIESLCGIDGTEAFEAQHENTPRAQATLPQFFIGNLTF